MEWTLAIVGGGLTGTAMLHGFVGRLLRLSREGTALPALVVHVFERREVFGPGLPHNDRVVLPCHITNMCAKDMSIVPGRPGDFHDWVDANRDSLLSHYPAIREAHACPDCSPGQCRHFPRAVMGAYLSARFREAVEKGRQLGLSICLHPETEVLDLWKEGTRLGLRGRSVRGGSTQDIVCDAVLLATGHWFGRSACATHFPSPWPAQELLAGVPPGETAAVLGSSLSAVEVALTLTSDGEFRRHADGRLVYCPPSRPRSVVLHSRGGLLPRVRGRVGARANLLFTCERLRELIAESPGAVSLRDVFGLLDRELTLAYGRSVDWDVVLGRAGCGALERLRRDIDSALLGDGPNGELIWQTVLHQVFPVARDLYLSLAAEERRRFDRLYTTVFFMHAATQPPVNARKLLALMECGLVRLVALGSDYRLERDVVTGEHVLSYRDSGGRLHRDAYRLLIDARGQPRSIVLNDLPLIRRLVRRGLVCLSEESSGTGEGRRTDVAGTACQTGSEVVEPETMRVVPEAGLTAGSPRLYAVGAMTRGQMIDASMAAGITRSAAAVTEDIVSWIASRCR